MHFIPKKQADKKIETLPGKSSYLKNEYLDFSQWHPEKTLPPCPSPHNVVNSAIMHIEWEIKNG